MTTHLMLDIESGAVKPGAVIYSIAMVRFADEAHTTINLDPAEQRAAGLFEDQDTLAWWMQQSPEARTAAFSNPVPVRPALSHMGAWIMWATAGGDSLIWCHGAGFDAPLLEALYKTFGMTPPWQWWNVRDTRTLYDLAGVDKRQYDVPPPHVALNDAIGQTRAANAALRVLARAHAA